MRPQVTVIGVCQGAAASAAEIVPVPFERHHWEAFQSFMMLTFPMSSVTMGNEDDTRSVVWYWMKQVIPGFFIFELAVRLKELLVRSTRGHTR